MTPDWKTVENKLNDFEIEIDRRIARDLKVGNIMHGNVLLLSRARTVYHYTDVKGALAILGSGSIWFTERGHLNDPMEVQHVGLVWRISISTVPRRRPADYQSILPAD